MNTEFNRLVQRPKVFLALAGYVLLSAFVLVLTLLTFQRGSGVGDWRNIATVVSLFGVFLISARLALATWSSH